MNLSTDAKVTVLSNAVAAGQTDVEASSVNMEGFDAVQFIIVFGAITSGAATTVKAQQSTDDASFADLLGTGQTVADTDDNKAFIIDIERPREQYVRPVVTRATQDSVVESIIAIQYKAAKKPVTHDSSTVGGSEQHNSPAEGTA